MSLTNLRERKAAWVSQLVFSSCVLVLFPFVLGTEPLAISAVRWGAFWVVQEFLVAMVMQRLFFAEQEAGAIDFLFAARVHRTAFFCAKVCFAVVQLFVLQACLTALWLLLFNVPLNEVGVSLSIVLQVIIPFDVGTAALGCILYGVTLRSLAREILFPILFFPLQFALVLACASLSLGASQAAVTGLFAPGAWWALLAGYPVIFCSLGVLFSDQLFKD